MKNNLDTYFNKSNNGKSLFVFSLVLLGILIAGTLYLTFSKSTILTKTEQVDLDISGLQSDIGKFKSENIEDVESVRQYIANLEKDEIRWSQAIKSVNEIVPTDAVTNKPKVKFLSYSGSSGGKVTLNAETTPSATDSFSYVADFVSVFNENSFFKDAYIPSITRGVSKTGDTILNFIFNLTYSSEDAEEVTTNTSVKVPHK